jgi:hypothetical protein
VAQGNLPAMRSGLEGGKSRIALFIREGHHGSLGGNRGAEGLARRLSAWDWWPLHGEEPFLAGDSDCVFQNDDPDAPFRAFPGFSGRIARIRFLMATRRLLVASPAREPQRLTPWKLDRAPACCSVHRFVSSCRLAENSALPTGIGDWAGIISKAAVDELVSTLEWDFWPKPPQPTQVLRFGLAPQTSVEECEEAGG